MCYCAGAALHYNLIFVFSQTFLDKARYGAEYRFFELLVNMVNAENVVNMVNIIEAGEEKMICVRDI